jgi:hypothetical protein
MKYLFKLSIYSALIFITVSCDKKINIENQFLSSSDTLIIKTNKIKANGLFDVSYGTLKFKDTSEKFSNSIKYPTNIKNLKRFQLKVDYKETKNLNVEILLGDKNDRQVFIVDENNNKDLKDDTIRVYEKMIWKPSTNFVKFAYLVSNGKKIVRDTSWIRVGDNNGRFLLGRRDYLIGKFKVDDEDYEIGVFDPRNTMSFTYSQLSNISIISKSGIKKDSVTYSDLLKMKEVLNLNGHYYRYESVSNNGDLITLVKDEKFKTKAGTQKGMIAPSFKAITISGDTITNSKFHNKFTIIANSCGCGGDKKSTEAYYEMEKIPLIFYT